VLELGSNGGQGYHGVAGLSSGKEGGWLAGWWPGFAGCGGCLVGMLCEEGWKKGMQGEGGNWWGNWNSLVGGSSWESPGRVWAVDSMVRSSRRASQWAAGKILHRGGARAGG